MMNRSYATAASLLIGLSLSLHAHTALASTSQTYAFNCFEGCTLDSSLAGGDIQLTVTDLGSSTIQFTLSNALGSQATIAQAYMDLGTSNLFTSSGLTLTGQSAGVNFSAGAKPSTPPGGNNIDFSTDYAFSRVNGRGGLANGINGGEWINIQGTLNTGKTYQDVLSALNTGVPEGMRVALHVQGIPDVFGNTASAGFLTTTSAVPEPETWAMLVAGLGLIGMRLRQKVVGTRQIS